jgi:predicted ATP-grasp superfamily ATP-dependent carboligase
MKKLSGPLAGGPPAVVLNTFHTGLGVARSLGPLGVRVVGMTPFAGFPGNRSRWLEFRRSSDSLQQPQQLLQELLAFAREANGKPVLFPTRDHDITFINNHRTELEQAYVVPFASPEIVDRAMNKDRLVELAQSVGIRSPRAVVIDAPGQTERVRGLRFPCICKPVYARQWRKPGIWEAVRRQKAVKAESFEDFRALYDSISALEPQMLVQEWVPGGEEQLQIFGSYCAREGGVRAFFTARKRLQYPALVGTGIVVEALPLAGLEAPSRALLDAIGFHGISEIEYKRDPRDGTLYLIEVNPRHWDQHQIGTTVGVNLSAVAYADATGRPWASQPQRPEPAVWVAEREFAQHVARALLGRAPLSDFGKIFFRRRTWSVFDAGDLGPFLSMLRLTPKAQ